MMPSDAYVARRYAQAFMNLYGSRLEARDRDALVSLATFLMDHKQILFLFKVGYIADDVQDKALDSLLSKFNVQVIEPIARLLLRSGRVFLLAGVATYICTLYDARHTLQRFKCITSHALTAQAQQRIQDFLVTNLGGTVEYTCSIDKKLIAGLRLLSPTHLWEYSLAKQIRLLELPLMR